MNRCEEEKELIANLRMVIDTLCAERTAANTAHAAEIRSISQAHESTCLRLANAEDMRVKVDRRCVNVVTECDALRLRIARLATERDRLRERCKEIEEDFDALQDEVRALRRLE